MKIAFASVTLLLNAALIAGAATTADTVAVVDTKPEATSVSTVSFAAAIDPASEKSSTRRRLEDDGPWEPGTPVSANFPDDGGWWDGVIAGYWDGAYTVQWSDGSTDTFADEDYVDEIVANANGPEGGGEAFFDMYTPISWQFDGEWWDGQITAYDGVNVYTVTWEDDSTDEYTDINLLSQMVNAYVQNNADDTAADAGYNGYDPWDINTPVYWHFQEDGHNTWWDGTLTNFDYVTGIYTVTWEDNSTDEYGPDDYELVDQMVQAAIDDDGEQLGGQPPDLSQNINVEQYEPWTTGTAVAWQFPDGYKEGRIEGFADGTYYIKWNDNSGAVESFTDLNWVNNMVDEAANGDGGEVDSEDQPWAVGTKVTWQFRDGWYNGEITKYEDGSYYIMWDDDSVDVYDNWDLVDKMVAEANDKAGNGQGQVDDQPYSVGTPVYTEFEDGWYKGVVESYNPYDGSYAVRYEDDTVYQYPPGLDMDQMVNAAANGYKKNTQMNGAGKFFVSVLVLTVGTIGGIYGYKRYKSGIESPSKAAFNEENLSPQGYKDEPESFELPHQRENLADVV